MITEYIHTQVKTTFSNEIVAALSSKMDDPDYKRPEKEILSQRYRFEIQIPFRSLRPEGIQASRQRVQK